MPSLSTSTPWNARVVDRPADGEPARLSGAGAAPSRFQARWRVLPLLLPFWSLWSCLASSSCISPSLSNSYTSTPAARHCPHQQTLRWLPPRVRVDTLSCHDFVALVVGEATERIQHHMASEPGSASLYTTEGISNEKTKPRSTAWMSPTEAFSCTPACSRALEACCQHNQAPTAPCQAAQHICWFDTGDF